MPPHRNMYYGHHRPESASDPFATEGWNNPNGHAGGMSAHPDAPGRPGHTGPHGPPNTPESFGRRPFFGPPGTTDEIPKCIFYMHHAEFARYLPLVAFIGAVILLFVVRKMERPRRPIGPWILDFNRQIVSAVISGFIAHLAGGATLEMSVGKHMGCRISLVIYFFETVIGIPVIYLTYKLLFRFSRYVFLGRKSTRLYEDELKFGLQSGAYGHPVKFTIFALQTLFLTVAFTVARLFVLLIVSASSETSEAVVKGLLGWSWVLGPGAEILLLKGIYPFLFWSIRFVSIDFLIRYWPRASSKDNEQSEYNASTCGFPTMRSHYGDEVADLEQLVDLNSSTTTDNDSQGTVVADGIVHLSTSSHGQSQVEQSMNQRQSSDVEVAIDVSSGAIPNEPPSYAIDVGSSQDTPVVDCPQVLSPEIQVQIQSSDDQVPEEELPTYDDSQREALLDRERQRQRILDMKRQHSP
ncbi:hypothetical protein V1511DRAFT_509006 [Dipodascopsis uninucleata]